MTDNNRNGLRFLRRRRAGSGATAASSVNDGARGDPSRPALAADTQGRDFGWRLHGRTVGVLAERSFKLVPSERPAARGFGSLLGESERASGVSPVRHLHGQLQPRWGTQPVPSPTNEPVSVGAARAVARRSHGLALLQLRRLLDALSFRGEAGEADGGHPANGGRALRLSGIRCSVRQSAAAMVADVCRGGGVRAWRDRPGRDLSARRRPGSFCQHVAAPSAEHLFLRPHRTGDLESGDRGVAGVARLPRRTAVASQPRGVSASPGGGRRRGGGPPPVLRLCRRPPAHLCSPGHVLRILGAGRAGRGGGPADRHGRPVSFPGTSPPQDSGQRRGRLDDPGDCVLRLPALGRHGGWRIKHLL